MHYSQITPELKKAFLERIEAEESILITSQKADEDGLASVLALYFILTQKYPHKNIKMVVMHYPNDRWAHLKNYQDIEFVEDARKYIADFPLVVFVDYSRYSYWNINRDFVFEKNVKTMCIDHHSSSHDDFDLSVVVTTATSTYELIYRIFCEDVSQMMNSHLAEILLVGILGDTGSLKHIGASKSYIYSIVQRLVSEHNIDVGSFISMWKQCTEREFKIVQEFIRNAKLERFPLWPLASSSFVTRKFVEAGRYTDIELDIASTFYVSNFSSLIVGSLWGFVIYPQSTRDLRIKIRSQSRKVSARAIMEHFRIGGGHSWSAGGVFPTQGSDILDSPDRFDTFREWFLKHRYDRILEVVEEVKN